MTNVTSICSWRLRYVPNRGSVYPRCCLLVWCRIVLELIRTVKGAWTWWVVFWLRGVAELLEYFVNLEGYLNFCCNLSLISGSFIYFFTQSEVSFQGFMFLEICILTKLSIESRNFLFKCRMWILYSELIDYYSKGE